MINIPFKMTVTGHIQIDVTNITEATAKAKELIDDYETFMSCKDDFVVEINPDNDDLGRICKICKKHNCKIFKSLIIMGEGKEWDVNYYKCDECNQYWPVIIGESK